MKEIVEDPDIDGFVEFEDPDKNSCTLYVACGSGDRPSVDGLWLYEDLVFHLKESLPDQELKGKLYNVFRGEAMSVEYADIE